MSRTKEHAPPDRGRSQAPAPLPITNEVPRSRRRPVVVGAGVALAAVGALVSVWMVNEAGDKVAVVATRHAIAAGDTVDASDLIAAEVSHDSRLQSVPASRSSELLGKRAVSDLPAGVLVTQDSVSAGLSVTKGKSVIGILAKPGQLPVQTLRTGDRVTVVHTPKDGGASATKPGPATDSLSAVVSRVGSRDANGAVVVDVAAADADSTSIAAWATGGDVAIVLEMDN